MYDFHRIAHMLQDIANTSATSQKEQMLRVYADTEGFKEVLKFIYDPYFTTGIGKKKLARVGDTPTIYTVEEIMRYLRVNDTGSDYDAVVANAFIFSMPDAVAEWAATCLVTKDMQIGVSVTTLNKVYGSGFIPIIGIMRGMLCPENASGIYIATEKIDGNRRIIMNKSSGVEIYTRSGRRDFGLVDIAEQAAMLPKDYVYDCECIAVGEFADSIELRQASASILNSGGKKTGVKAMCFDMLSQSEYDAGKSKFAAYARKAILAGTFCDYASTDLLQRYFIERDLKNGTGYANSINAVYRMHKGRSGLTLIAPLPILGVAHNKAEGVALAQPIWETGGEGVMLVAYNSAYEVNPNPRPTLLKIKATKEHTVYCCGVYEGNGRLTGTLGGITILHHASDNNTYKVDCGSGFPDYLRDEYWNDPTRIIGKLVEIESFGESRNATGNYSLNCPRFKRIAGEKE